MSKQRLQLSILDYSPVDEGLMASDALSASVRLAQSAEKNGIHRYWVSEHHGMPAAASNSPEILMSRIASATQKIRVGSGAVLLPNYSSLKIAENYQLLDHYFQTELILALVVPQARTHARVQHSMMKRVDQFLIHRKSMI